jgi:hypothetical protein
MSSSFVRETDMTITALAVTEPKTAARNGSYAAAADQTAIAAAADQATIAAADLGSIAQGAQHVLLIIGARRTIADLDTAMRRIRGHSPPLQDARARAA